MVTVLREGVDYSRGGFPFPATLLRMDKRFVGRYAVADLSPDGRGITRAEFQALASAGLDTYLYYEEKSAWMLGDADTTPAQAGINAAKNVVVNIANAWMPYGMPAYYSHDVEPTPDQFPALHDCVSGAASVVGWHRVAFYGGYDAIDYLSRSTLITKYCQTIAWQGNRGIHPAACLHQYNTGTNLIDGVDCDFVAQLLPSCGFASEYLTHPTTTTTPVPYPQHRIPPPDTLTSQGFPLVVNVPPHDRFKCVQGGHSKTYPSLDAPDVSVYKADQWYTFGYRSARPINGLEWLLSDAGSWAPKKNFA